MENPEQELTSLVRALREYFQAMQVSGISWFPAIPISNSPSVIPPDTALPTASQTDRSAHGLLELGHSLENCTRCRLANGRKTVVFGDGDPHAEIMFVGEGPGHEEDLQGLPFVGPAGQLLTRMIEAMGLTRQSVYICNIVKCRPPQNRDPSPDEIASCEEFIKQQIQLISPRIIITLGNVAAKTLLQTTLGITRLRGNFHAYDSIPVMPTFHPSYLLRNPESKRAAWNDLKMVMNEIDRMGLRRSK